MLQKLFMLKVVLLFLGSMPLVSQNDRLIYGTEVSEESKDKMLELFLAALHKQGFLSIDEHDKAVQNILRDAVVHADMNLIKVLLKAGYTPNLAPTYGNQEEPVAPDITYYAQISASIRNNIYPIVGVSASLALTTLWWLFGRKYQGRIRSSSTSIASTAANTITSSLIESSDSSPSSSSTSSSGSSNPVNGEDGTNLVDSLTVPAVVAASYAASSTSTAHVEFETQEQAQTRDSIIEQTLAAIETAVDAQQDLVESPSVSSISDISDDDEAENTDNQEDESDSENAENREYDLVRGIIHRYLLNYLAPSLQQHAENPHFQRSFARLIAFLTDNALDQIRTLRNSGWGGRVEDLVLSATVELHLEYEYREQVCLEDMVLSLTVKKPLQMKNMVDSTGAPRLIARIGEFEVHSNTGVTRSEISRAIEALVNARLAGQFPESVLNSPVAQTALRDVYGRLVDEACIIIKTRLGLLPVKTSDEKLKKISIAKAKARFVGRKAKRNLKRTLRKIEADFAYLDRPPQLIDEDELDLSDFISIEQEVAQFISYINDNLSRITQPEVSIDFSGFLNKKK